MATTIKKKKKADHASSSDPNPRRDTFPPNHFTYYPFIHSRFIKLPQGALHCARYWRKNNKWDTLLGLREHESREFQHYSHLCFMFLICESHPSKMPTPPSWCRWTNWTCHPWLWAKSEIKCVSLSWSHKISCLPTSPPISSPWPFQSLLCRNLSFSWT